MSSSCGLGSPSGQRPGATTTTAASSQPTPLPTLAPTFQPTRQPSTFPTDATTRVPTEAPTTQPTSTPTQPPTATPTAPPSMAPTVTQAAGNSYCCLTNKTCVAGCRIVVEPVGCIPVDSCAPLSLCARPRDCNLPGIKSTSVNTTVAIAHNSNLSLPCFNGQTETQAITTTSERICSSASNSSIAVNSGIIGGFTVVLVIIIGVAWYAYRQSRIVNRRRHQLELLRAEEGKEGLAEQVQRMMAAWQIPWEHIELLSKLAEVRMYSHPRHPPHTVCRQRQSGPNPICMIPGSSSKS